jgi:hypothetical protein
MPDRAEQISKKLRTALREEAREKNNLNSSVSLGVQKTHARKYVEAHLKVKALRTGLITELGIEEPKLEDLLGDGDGQETQA